MESKTVRLLFATLRKDRPEPASELVFRSPFELLVAVVLSAQATDRMVNQITPALFAQAPTPEAMALLGEEAVASLIRRIGLYRTKARHLVAASRILVERFGSELPRDREALQTLPGVGRKTANVVLNVAFGEPTLAVDTHVFRVANRTGLAPAKTPEAVEARLLQIIPGEFLHHAHHWLILHGRHVCQARRPRCEVCIIRHCCEQLTGAPPTANGSVDP